jgi:hypothetical protein
MIPLPDFHHGHRATGMQVDGPLFYIGVSIHSFIKKSFVKYQFNDKCSIFMKNNI